MNPIKKFFMNRRLKELEKIEGELKDIHGSKKNDLKQDDLKNLNVKGDYITKDTSFTLLYLILVGIVIIVAMTIFYQDKFNDLNNDFNLKVEELRDTYEELTAKEKEFNETQQKLVIKESREETLEEQYQSVLAEKEALQRERSKLVDEKTVLQKSLSEANTQILDLKNRIELLEERIEELENEAN